MGDQVIKTQTDPLQFRRSGMHAKRIVIKQRGVVGNADLNNRVDIAAFLDFPVGIGGIPHERGSAELEIPQIIGMVDDPGTVRVGVKGAVPASVPHQPVGRISDIAVVAVQYFRDKRFRPQFIFL
jgi:hypothetical protein